MAMPEPRAQPLRVAVVGTAEAERRSLCRLLAAAGLEVVLEVSPEALPCERIEDWRGAEVILLDLDDGDEASMACLARLAEGPPLPLVFVDGETVRSSAGVRLGRVLAEKLAAEAGRAPPAPPREAAPARAQPLRVVDAAAGRAPERAEAGEETGAPAAAGGGGEAPVEVWGLGASIGGPQALKRFLSRLPADLPFGFVLAQHIGENFLDLLAHQLDRETALRVRVARDGDRLGAGGVLVVPVGRAPAFCADGRVRLRPLGESVYDPSIDRTLEAVAAAWGERAGAILFSGMGDDGLRGCHEIVRRGGTVWAQEPESCVVSSMADQARERGYVGFSGTPEQLADHLRARALRLARAAARVRGGG